MKTNLVLQTKQQLRHNISKHVNFGNIRDLLMMRISNKLTKRTTKTEKIKKSLKILKMYSVINFKIILFAINWLLRVKSPIQP